MATNSTIINEFKKNIQHLANLKQKIKKEKEIVKNINFAIAYLAQAIKEIKNTEQK